MVDKDGGRTADSQSDAVPGTGFPTGPSSAPAPPQSNGTSLPIDEVFALLRNERRRNVLHYLAAHDNPVSLSDLAEQLAAWENDKPVAHLRSDERKRVYVGLYQVHLPKMADADVVEFNQSRGVIEIGRHADICYWYLSRATDSDGTPPWYRYYAGVSVVSAIGLLLAMWLQPQTALPVADIAAAGVVLGFCTCSAWHFWWYRDNVTDGGAATQASADAV